MVSAYIHTVAGPRAALRLQALDIVVFLMLSLVVVWRRTLGPVARKGLSTITDPLVTATLCLLLFSTHGWLAKDDRVHDQNNPAFLVAPVPPTLLEIYDGTAATSDGLSASNHISDSALVAQHTVRLRPDNFTEMQRAGYAPRVAPNIPDPSPKRIASFHNPVRFWGVFSPQLQKPESPGSFRADARPDSITPIFDPVGRLSIFAPSQDDTLYTVMLDPGHGGTDPGTIGAEGLLEKHVTLDIARRVQHRLAVHPNIQVLLTRYSDRGHSRDSRMQTVRSVNPDALVSLHVNNLPQRHITLVESFYAGKRNILSSELGNGKNLQARFTRTRTVGKQDYSFIEGSRKLAEILQNRIFPAVAEGNPTAVDNGVKQDTLYMLTQSYVPATLIELTCLSNSEEEERLRTPAYREQIATAIAAGILEYFSSSGDAIKT